MKLSKMAVAVLFGAAFLTTSATAGLATEKIEPTNACAVGYATVEDAETGAYSCEIIETLEGETSVGPDDSCWTTDDGVMACARGGIEPMPTMIEDSPVLNSDCTVTTDEEGVTSEVCQKAVPYGVPSEEDGGVGYVEDGTDENSQMYETGVMAASAADPTVSNTVAVLGVLAGVLGAVGIAINRRKAAK